MNQEKVGKFIKEIRTKNNLTQGDFAKKYGVTYQAVSNWENGKNLPDITLLKKISSDFNVSIEDILEGNKTKKKKNIQKITLIVLISIIFIMIILISIFNKSSDFEFKTITSNCPNFTISGSISYNKNKTSIHINNVNYCSGNDTTAYKKIECTLYEQNNDTETKISSCDSKNIESIKLDEYLKQVEFTIDDYSKKCKTYTDESLYLRINATDESGKITTYKIPLALNSTCSK